MMKYLPSDGGGGLAGGLPGGPVGSGSGIFIGQKISQIRWKPRSDTSTLVSQFFLTGSWDDGASNKVSLWRTGCNEKCEPELASSLNHVGDVNKLQFINPEIFVSGSSTGSVHLVRILRESGNQFKLVAQNSWDNIHSKNGCSGLSAENDTIATVGQDGKINVLNAKQKAPISVIEKADSCSLTCVEFVKHDQIMSANMRGQMKLWDLRSHETAVSTFFLSNTADQIGINCIARHPTQSHVLCTGSEDGMLAIWDLRSGCHPVTLLNAHKQAVSEVQFHHQQPDHIFSCSQNGDIWHWDASAVTRANLLHYGNQQSNNSMMMSCSSPPRSSSSSPWLSSEAVKHKVESRALMSKQSLPINSLDALGSSIIFAGDNEAIYHFPSVIL